MPSGSTAEYDLRSGGETSTRRTYEVSKLCALRGDQLLDFQAYNNPDPGPNTIEITYGHPRDNRRDLKRFVITKGL